MKRLFSLFLSLVMLTSAVFCVDLSAYAYSSENADSYFNQFTDGNETEEAIDYIDDEIDTLFDYLIKNISFSYKGNYDGKTPTYDFMALVSGSVSSMLADGSMEDISPDYTPFDEIYYLYLNDINYNNCDFCCLYNIAKTDFSDNADVQNFAGELSEHLDANLNLYQEQCDYYNNEYNNFNKALSSFIEIFGENIFYFNSEYELSNYLNEVLSDNGLSMDDFMAEFDEYIDFDSFFSYVQRTVNLYDSSIEISSLEGAIYYSCSTPLVCLYPIMYAIGDRTDVFDGYYLPYYYFVDQGVSNYTDANDLLTTSEDGYYTDIQKSLVNGVLQSAGIYEEPYSLTENDFVILKDIFNGHLTRTATVSAVSDSDLDASVKYYFDNYLTNDAYQQLNSDFKNWTEGSSYASSMDSLKDTVENEIYFPYIIYKYFNVKSNSLNLIDLFREYGHYGSFIKDNLSCILDDKFELDLSDKQSKEIWINIANTLINQAIDIVKNDIVENIINALLSVDIDLEAVAKDVYIRFAEKPAQTTLELLPTVITVLDDVIIPVIFNAEGDNYYQTLTDLLLNNDNGLGLLYDYSQNANSEIGIGQIGWDLNTVLPNLLDFLLDYKSINDFEIYSEPYSSDIPKIINVYAYDKMIVDAKDNLSKSDFSVIKELIVFAKEIVDEYLGSDYVYNVKLDKDGNQLNSGLNNIFAALPQLIEIMENNFADDINLSREAWSYLDEGTVVVNSNGSSENGLLIKFKSIAANPVAETTLNVLCNDFITKVLNKTINLANVLITEENKVKKNAPFISGIVNSLGIFDESSPLVFALNNAFDLNDSNSKFTLPELSNNTVLFLMSNIEKIINMFVDGFSTPPDSESESISQGSSSATDETINENTAFSTAEEIITFIDDALAKDLTDFSSVLMNELQTELESKDDSIKAKAQIFADEVETLLNAYLDVINNQNISNSNLNTIIDGVYIAAEKYFGFIFDSTYGNDKPLSDFMEKLVTGMISPTTVSVNINDVNISSELIKYDSWEELKESGVEIDWGLKGESTVDFFNALCNGFPRINKVADIVINDTDLYSDYITTIYNQFDISLQEDTLDSSLSKIITPLLIGFKDTLDNGVFSSILLNFENIEYFGYNIDYFNNLINNVFDLTVNEFYAVAYTLLPNIIQENKINASVTEETYFNAVSSFISNIFANVADDENMPGLKSIELKPYYYETDISGLSKTETYEALFCEHIYTKTIVEPTCTEEGYIEYTCVNCGDEYWEFIDALGHNYVDGICINCNSSFLSENGLYSYEYFSYVDNSIIITDYFGNENILEIPALIDNHHVCVIGESAFANNDDLQSVVIPEGVESIRFDAFVGCYNLKSIVFPDTLTSITVQAFACCSSLEKVDLPDNLSSLGAIYSDSETFGNVFQGCYNLKEIHIPVSLKMIASGTFDGCYSLTDVYYDGSEEEWNNITIGINNSCLTDATIHYNSTGHTHSYDSGTVLKNATCTTDGERKYTCIDCGDEYIEVIPATGHNYVDNVCTNCDEEFLTIRNHETKNITISTAGECRYIQFIPTESVECTFFSTGTYDTYGYIYDLEMNELVHDDDSGDNRNFSITYNFEAGQTYYLGVRFYNSSTTGSFDVTLCSHEYDAENAEIIEPTCSNSGYTKNTCIHCGYISKTDYVDALEHTYVITETVEPTCEQQGYTEYTCTVCSGSYKSYTDALMHNFVDGVCEKCGETVESIALNEIKEINISEAGDYKYLSFTPEEDFSYTFYSNGSYDTYGYLYDSDMNGLWADDDGGDGTNFSISYTLEAGKTYYLRVNYYLIFEPEPTTVPTTALTTSQETEPTTEIIEEATTSSSENTKQNNHIFYVTVEKTCNHNYEENVIAPTCTESGYTEHTCTVCGKSYRDNYISAIGHNFGEWETTENAGCVEVGTKERVCSNCGKVETESISALGHDWNSGVITTQPTCTETGIKTYTCSRCSSTKTEIVDKIPHTYETVLTEPTCTEQGYTTYTCSVCGDTFRGKYTDALGHIEAVDEAVEPTCTETGLTEGSHCSRCNEILVKQETVAALGHSFTDYVSDGNATCTKDGTKTAKCDRCDVTDTVTDVGSALGHIEVIDEAVAPTCTEKGLTEGKHCSRCNEILVKQEAVAALGHSFTDYVSDGNATCTKDGTKTAKCDRCDVTDTVTDVGSALGHIEVIDEAVAPTCTEKGLTEGKHCSRCNEILIKQETVAALGHDWNDGVITKEPTCTETGIKTYTCSRCSETKTETLNKTEHLYTPQVVEPTCTERGYTIYVCDACSTNYISDYVDALGHDYSEEWTVDKETTCTVDGSKSHHCSRCDSKTDITVIEAAGHNYGEWQTRKTATCTDGGIDYRVCSVCGNEELLVTKSLGHNYENWAVTKQATVLCEGSEESTCTRCGNKASRTIDKIQVDINNTDEYGLANFTVVNAQTKEPIKNAGIFISTENDGENTFFTDENGKVSVVLPVGKQVVSAYADGCLTRNLNVNVNSGSNDIPLIGLSDKPTYDAEVTHHLMTIEEIEEAGIDTEAKDNNHIYKYELRLNFEPEIDWLSLCYYMNSDGEILGGSGSGSGSGSGGNYTINWTGGGSGSSGTGGHFNIKDSDGEEFSVYPVSEYFYLIIRGEVKWLKEMFDVEMLVINNSNTDTLENLTATLNLPEGLSLATMVDEQQTLEQEIGTVGEGSTKSVHWYVRGDKAGSYSIEANLKGMVMPFEEEINDTFVADKSLQVWAGNAMHLDFEFPDAAYYGEDYPITITLTNVSDITLYNVNHMVQIEQGMEVYYSDGTCKKKIEKSQWKSVGVDEFNPGDKIIIEASVNIFFESEMMERELEKLIGIIDGVEQFLKGFKAVKTAYDIADGLVGAVGGAIKGINTFVESMATTTDKLILANTLKETIVDFEMKYSKFPDDVFDCAIKLANSGVGATLNALTEDPVEWLENSSEADIRDLINKIKALGNSIEPDPTEEQIKNFNIFDSLRTMVSAIPIRFALKSVIMTENENNTTSIPWTYNMYSTGAHYFGVSDMGNYITNIAKAIMAETYEEAVPSTIQMLPGCDDPMNYNDVKRQIIATENEIKQFQAKTATGDVTFNVRIVRNEKSVFSARSDDDNDDFIISCDNENAVYEDGVLTFTGNGTIDVTPTSLTGGTLYIESSEGNTYTYEISVVKQHECSASEWHTVIAPTAENDGFAVKCCDICDDILDVELLSAKECAHDFGEWQTETESSCASAGVKARECSLCGYQEIEFIEKENHNYELQSIEYTGSQKITTYKCSECGEISETSLDCEVYLAAVQTANELKQNGLDKYQSDAVENFNSSLVYAKELADKAENTEDVDNAAKTVLEAVSLLKDSLKHITVTYVTVSENSRNENNVDLLYGEEFSAQADNTVTKITYSNGSGETALPITDNISFIATENATVTMYTDSTVSVGEKEYTAVKFLDKGGRVFAVEYAENGTTIDISGTNVAINGNSISAPTVAFYDFTGWEPVSGKTESADGNDIVLQSVYSISKSSNFCNIIGLDGVTVNGEASYLAYYDELVTLSASSGKRLAYTDSQGEEIYAYINGSTIYAPNSANVYIKEVEEAVSAKSAIVGVYNEDSRAGFNCQFSLPDDAVLVECGVVITMDDTVADNDFEIGTDGTSKFKSNKQGNNNEYSVSLKYSSAHYGKTIYAKSYLTYKNADGEICTVYSNMNSIYLEENN